jgi:hypothetical protein
LAEKVVRERKKGFKKGYPTEKEGIDEGQEIWLLLGVQQPVQCEAVTILAPAETDPMAAASSACCSQLPSLLGIACYSQLQSLPSLAVTILAPVCHVSFSPGAGMTR